MSLRVLDIYGHATFQGAPTLGLRRYGVPSGGAFDQESFQLSNALLGNQLDAAMIELAMGSIKLEAIHTTRIAITGAEGSVLIDNRPARCQAALQLFAGQVIEVGPPSVGARIYLGAPELTNPKKNGDRVRAGDVIETSSRSVSNSKPIQRPTSLDNAKIRILPFEDSSDPLGAARVRMQSDRVGIRLEGIQMDPGEEKLSEPACPGTIQVTNDGNLVILGPDGPTIGGYRKVAVVCSADIDKLAQLRPGQEFAFETITQEGAIVAWKEREEDLEARLRYLASIH